MSQAVVVDKLLEERDVDAALYLLQRLLDLSADALGQKRAQLERAKERIERARRLTRNDRHLVATSYREVLG
jgi:hypothetical protein